MAYYKSFGCTMLQRVEGQARLTGQYYCKSAHVRIVVMEITNHHNPYGFDFLFPTRTWEYAPEDARPGRCRPSWIMHPAKFPELRIVSGGLSVKNPCNFGALNENIILRGRRSP